MKKLCTVLAIALLSIGINAQEAKPEAKKETKKEAKKDGCSADAKSKDGKAVKSCCSKKA